MTRIPSDRLGLDRRAALSLLLSLPFGLAAYAFTSSGATATAIGDALQSGMVGVNSVAISTPETPFGGVKESGYGHEGGTEGIEAYLNRKLVVEA